MRLGVWIEYLLVDVPSRRNLLGQSVKEWAPTGQIRRGGCITGALVRGFFRIILERIFGLDREGQPCTVERREQYVDLMQQTCGRMPVARIEKHDHTICDNPELLNSRYIPP